jgi:uncharacterized protein YciI
VIAADTVKSLKFFAMRMEYDMQFMITAYDDIDPEALNRRLQVREQHFANVAPLKESGQFIAGGAILDDTGNMIGSTLYMDFASREKLDEWINNDPYVTNGVWHEIRVDPIKLAFR